MVSACRRKRSSANAAYFWPHFTRTQSCCTDTARNGRHRSVLRFLAGWACDDVSLYLVANDDARRQLIDYGVDPEKIKISGLPLHPKFQEVDDAAAQKARTAFGLDPDKFTVFVNAGWIGGGNIPAIFKELVRGELDVQAIFLAGKNEDLRLHAEKLAESAKFPVKVIGYSDEIEKLMQSANVMISKLGGLTTFEALACRLPIIGDATTPPMPQEAGTLDLIRSAGPELC